MALRKSGEFLNLFWDLAEFEDSTRIEAVVGILNALRSNEDDEVKQDLRYTVERLVKGLTSERKSARLGFFTALTIALKTFDEILVEDVLELVDKHLKPTENNEKRNCIIGQSLLCAAVIRSEKKLTDEQLNIIATKLLATGSKKFYLEVFISNILTNLLEKLNVKKFTKIVFPIFTEILSCGWANATPFNFWLLLNTSRLFPTIVNKNYLKEHWEHNVLVKEDTCKQLAQIMMKSTSAHPKIHPVCVELVSAAQNLKIFDYFWETVVDNTLISAGQEKVYLSFELIKITLPKLETTDDVKSILKENFIRQFIQNLSHEELPLHCAAKKLADFFVTFVSTCEDTSIQSVIVQRFLTKPGTILFDKITKTRTIASLLSELKFEALDDVTTFLMEYISGNSGDGVINSVDADNHRVVAAKQLEHLFKHKSLVKKNWQWKKKVIQFFVENAFFDVKSSDQEKSVVSPEMHSCLSSCLLRIYGQITTQTFNYWKPNIQDLLTTYYESIELCNNLFKDPTRSLPTPACSQEVMIHWNRLWKVVKSIRERIKPMDSGKMATDSCIFEILYLQMMLQLLVNPEEIVPFIEEVEICYEKAMEHESEDEDEPNWIQVLIDIILSFVSKAEQKPFHCIVESIMHLLAPRLTVKTVQQILNVISPHADESDILVDEDEEEMEEECADESSDSNDDDATSEESLSSEDEDLEEGETKSFDAAMQLALTNESDESDIDLDQVDQAELDRKDEIFAELLRLKKKPGVQAECDLRNFKLRCLNLLNIIVDVYPTIPVICSMIVPILEIVVEFAYKNQESRVLHVRAETLLRRLVIQKEFEEPIDPSEKPDFLAIWHQIVGMAEKISNLHITVDLADAITLLTRCMKKWSSNDADLLNELVKAYKSLMDRYFVERTSHIHLSFISTFLDKNLDLAGEFLIDIIDFTARSDVRLYKKTQSLGLAATIINRPEVLKDWKLKKWNIVYSKLDNSVKKSISDMGTEMKPTFASNLFKVYLSFYQQYKKIVGKPFEIISEDLITPIFHNLPKAAKKFIRKLNQEREKMGKDITVLSPKTTTSKKRKREEKLKSTNADPEAQDLAEEIPEQSEPIKKKSPKKRRKSSLNLIKAEDQMEVTISKKKAEEKLQSMHADTETQDLAEKIPEQSEPKKKKSPKKRRKSSLNLKAEQDPIEVTISTPDKNTENVVNEETKIKIDCTINTEEETKELEKSEIANPSLEEKIDSEVNSIQNGIEEVKECEITYQNGFDEFPELVIDESDNSSSCQIICEQVIPESPVKELQKRRKLEKDDDITEKCASVTSNRLKERLTRAKTSTLAVVREEVGSNSLEDDPFDFKSDLETSPIKYKGAKRSTTLNSAKKIILNGQNTSPVELKDIYGNGENALSVTGRRPIRTRTISETSSVDGCRRSSRLQNKKLK
uniref:Uncharacterized protein n=1 Tax=Strigamia maritima TaxID=126957 RepID=T1J2H4_STRMM